MEKFNLLGKIAKQDEEVIKLNADLDQVTKMAKMMSKGTDDLEEMLQKQNYGKPKPIGFEHEIVKQQMKFNNATIHTPINNTFVSGGLSQQSMGHPIPRLHGYPRRVHLELHTPVFPNVTTRKEWREKKKIT
ncbi:hypothetical protein L195_g058055, partial [Trifolium pratense]